MASRSTQNDLFCTGPIGSEFSAARTNLMTRPALLLCKSVHHGNTLLVAERIAAVLDAMVVDPDEAEVPVTDSTLIGIGSGIYFARFHKSIRDWLKRLPENAGRGHQAFLFSTSGLPFLSALYHRPLRRALERKGFEVVGSFSCRGHDTFGPLWILGGLNRKHPSERDFRRAERFADHLISA
jgi:flavodoxin